MLVTVILSKISDSKTYFFADRTTKTSTTASPGSTSIGGRPAPNPAANTSSIVRKLSAEFDSRSKTTTSSTPEVTITPSSSSNSTSKISKSSPPLPTQQPPTPISKSSHESSTTTSKQPQSLTSLEKNLFPSLEPSDGHKVDEEFDKLTNESRLDSLLTKDTSKLDELLEVDDSNSVPLIDKVSHLENVATIYSKIDDFVIFVNEGVNGFLIFFCVVTLY